MVSAVLRAFPETLVDFQRMFPTEQACLDYLSELRWPDGFVCPSCKTASPAQRLATRPAVLRCRECRAETSLTAGTVLHRTRTPLRVWFWGAYLVTSQTPGMSALQFQRQLGVRRYETAFQILHKLRASMVRPDRDRIGPEWPVEMDESLIGGRTRGEGRGVHHMATVIGAVEVRRTRDAIKRRDAHEHGVPVRGEHYAGRLRLRMIPSRNEADVEDFVTKNVSPGSKIATDGWEGYDRLRKHGYEIDSLVLHGDPDLAKKHLPMIHVVYSNLKNWLDGTHHSVSHRHLPAYLNEFVFRFNRRFYPRSMLNSVLGIALTAKGPPTPSSTLGTGPTRRHRVRAAWPPAEARTGRGAVASPGSTRSGGRTPYRLWCGGSTG